MKLRDYVLAQLHHEETDFIPYEYRIDRDAGDKLTEYYGSGEWWNNLLWPLIGSPAYFDSWNTFRPLDPNDPTKVIDAYGNHWTQTKDIAHLDRCAMYGMEPQDYKWPTIDAFYGPERRAEMERWAAAIPDDRFSLVNLGAGHWELIWRLLGVEDALILTIDDPDLFDDIIEHLDVLLHQFLDAVIDRPVDSVYICDYWCDQRSCMIGTETWRRHIKPRLAKFYKRIHDSGKYVIQHVCGKVDPLIPDLLEIGLDVLESVQSEAMDVPEMKRLYGDRLTFFGALGVQRTVPFGTPAEIRDEIRNLRATLGKGGGFILAPAKHLNSAVPAENLAAIYETFIEENYKFC
ncbi:MAG: hypothetical protein J6Z80_04250 [Clostridia bacterium]|nr:hypothetical protein [Clostridia bacterium]